MINVLIQPTTIQPKVESVPQAPIEQKVIPKAVSRKIVKTLKASVKPTTLKPKPRQKEASTEPREVVIAGIEDPKGMTESEMAPIVNMFKLQEFFGVFQPNYKEQKVLNDIYQYYESQGITSMGQVFIQILEAEKRLGHTPLGQSRLNHLWNYLKVMSQISEYGDLKKSYERI